MNKKINVSEQQDNHIQNNIQSQQNTNMMGGESFKNNELQKTLLDMNKSLRRDIQLSVAIFKQKNNFEHNYINHKFKNAF